ncbi:hypothetical protein [Nocardia sp. Marseille-Q1738]
MRGEWDLLVLVVPDDGDELDAAFSLRGELLDLDIDAAELVDGGEIPDGAKSASGVVATLGVKLGPAALKAVFAKIRDWLSRTERSVELTIDGDTIKLTGATAAQQEQLLAVWLARHGSRT